MNPIVAKLIVIFQNAYKQLSTIIPQSDDFDDESFDENNENNNINGWFVIYTGKGLGWFDRISDNSPKTISPKGLFKKKFGE